VVIGRIEELEDEDEHKNPVVSRTKGYIPQIWHCMAHKTFVDFLFVQYILALSWLLKYSFENEIFRGCSLKFWEVVLDPALSVTNFIGEGR
jgi:hypothetical protein